MRPHLWVDKTVDMGDRAQFVGRQVCVYGIQAPTYGILPMNVLKLTQDTIYGISDRTPFVGARHWKLFIARPEPVSNLRAPFMGFSFRTQGGQVTKHGTEFRTPFMGCTRKTLWGGQDTTYGMFLRTPFIG